MLNFIQPPITNTGEAFQGKLRTISTEIIFALLVILIFALFKEAAHDLARAGSWQGLIIPLITLAICAVTPGPIASAAAPSPNIVIRVIGLLLGLYAVLAVVTYPSDISRSADFLEIALRIASYLALLFSILSFWRPALVMVPVAVVMAKKGAAAHLFGIQISPTDYIPLVEMAIFLGLGLSLLGGGTIAKLRARIPAAYQIEIRDATLLLFMMGVAAHFSNYFFSGLQKIMLDGGPLFWVRENPTDLLSINAWVEGSFPFAQWPEFALFSVTAAGLLVPIINSTILIGQLASVVFITRRATMIAVTLFYNLTHLIIFLLTGIFFWKWIVLNLALVAAMRKLPKRVEHGTIVILAVIVTIMAPHVFTIARLGWYDTPALVSSQLFAVTSEG
ncbi:hypothetical protein [Breoghania sp.]|uniref:hypothetical protein n=1 Tax=Breoghania sp. TaxID=2065378 RepID=UPI002610A573|nr:hypothetical protein [Breoghania sp.]MDJ0933096.1 hypothetical protein [Breoghania sp.]